MHAVMRFFLMLAGFFAMGHLQIRVRMRYIISKFEGSVKRRPCGLGWSGVEKKRYFSKVLFIPFSVDPVTNI